MARYGVGPAGCEDQPVTGKDASEKNTHAIELELATLLDAHIGELRSRGVSEPVLNQLRAELAEVTSARQAS